MDSNEVLLWCSGCTTDKPASAFSRNKYHRAGRANWCKACIKLLYQKPEYLTRRKERREADWSYSLTIECRGRARKRGLPFNITKEDLAVPELCPVLGIKLVPPKGARQDDSPSVDRIIPANGYVKGNVAVISWLANRLKSDCDKPEFFEAIAAYMRRMVNAEATHRSGIPATTSVCGVSSPQAAMGLHSGAPQSGEKRSVRHGPHRRRLEVQEDRRQVLLCWPDLHADEGHHLDVPEALHGGHSGD